MLQSSTHTWLVAPNFTPGKNSRSDSDPEAIQVLILFLIGIFLPLLRGVLFKVLKKMSITEMTQVYAKEETLK